MVLGKGPVIAIKGGLIAMTETQRHIEKSMHEYANKQVTITCTDGDVIRGKVDFYTTALNDPDGRPSLTLKGKHFDGCLIDVYIDEISSIEIDG